ncbi:MAG TPA: hypothetical protein VMD92_17765 [Acidobacteriaceae bacterium]|jgi:hypothetical protein|nr:hypothetical protein [Acidobacteriaceae bacterium]
MAYPLKKDPKEPDYRRLPGLRDLQKETLVADKLREDPGPKTLGARPRQLTVMLALVGLATLFAPLAVTSTPVMGQSHWSPWEIATGMLTGNLPAAVLLTSKGLGAVRWLTFANSALFGGLFVYMVLTGVLVVAMGKAQRIIVGALAALGLVAALIEIRSFSDLQLAILGGPPSTVDGQQVHAMALGYVWFGVLILILVIAAWKELEDL